MTKCERCGSLNGIPASSHRHWETPDVWDYLCRDCAEEVNVHTVEEMTDGELVAAIMHDSIGYASPRHAAQHVEAFHDGDNFAFCERACACFPADLDEYDEDELADVAHPSPGDLNWLIERARRTWCRLDGDKRDRLEEFAEAWERAEDNTEACGVSAMYPTGAP